MKRKFLIQLNEINFDWVKLYIDSGKLPKFKSLLSEYKLIETSSENSYEDLEPWIQWVTVYTGKEYSEHGVFRLGDINQYKGDTIFEKLKDDGCRSAAISPMNFDNKSNSVEYFIPDPWTKAEVSGGSFEKGLYSAIRQAVNDNASGKLTPNSYFSVFKAILKFFGIRDYLKLLKFVVKLAFGKSWYKAITLDYLLFAMFKKISASDNYDFNTVFLNAGAHIQHHYMFNSSVYSGKNRNPSWYVSSEHDPVLDIYEEYADMLFHFIEKSKDNRVLVCTALTQIPFDREKYYWRLTNHSEFLTRLGVEFREVLPRMTRDFLVTFNSQNEKTLAEQKLSELTDQGGNKLFAEIELRDEALFIVLTYPHEINDSTIIIDQNGNDLQLKNFVSFVALKNGMHHQKGFLFDTNNNFLKDDMPLKEVYDLLLSEVN